jgi:hypothetical protein
MAAGDSSPPATPNPNPGTLTRTLTSPEELARVGEEARMEEIGVNKNSCERLLQITQVTRSFTLIFLLFALIFSRFLIGTTRRGNRRSKWEEQRQVGRHGRAHGHGVAAPLTLREYLGRRSRRVRARGDRERREMHARTGARGGSVRGTAPSGKERKEAKHGLEAETSRSAARAHHRGGTPVRAGVPSRAASPFLSDRL